ncbi:DUF7285 family protein [Halobacterium yunchengense]|uniref:DUF7285 family protein n=1 Tax=Halobacterium yunchengense TaxID=3108497 RepID=UPI0030092447
MSRSSARRAQVEPLPAIVAVTVLCAAVATYGAVRADALSGLSGDRAPAEQVLADAVDATTPEGSVVVDPDRLTAADVAPAGFEASVTVTAGSHEWRAGAGSPPPNAATASQRAPVRVDGEVRPGRVTAEVWS